MKFEELVRLTSDLQCFSTQFLFAGKDPRQVRLQLNRWSRSGKVVRIHKGFYTLADEYRKIPIEPAYIAQQLHGPSYVSLQYALSWYHLIPEEVPLVTSVTTDRPKELHTAFGVFRYRHIRPEYFCGFQDISLASGDKAFFSLPEKALLDLVYLTPGSDSREYIKGLRLQNLENFDNDRLEEQCSFFPGRKMQHACEIIESYIEEEQGE